MKDQKIAKLEARVERLERLVGLMVEIFEQQAESGTLLSKAAREPVLWDAATDADGC
jgi:hypothetical protein